MPAIGWLLLSGALDALDKRDAAAAEAAKAERERLAEVNLYKAKKGIDAEYEAKSAAAEAKAKAEEHTRKINSLVVMRNQRASAAQAAGQNVNYIVNPISYTLDEIPLGATNYATADEVTSQFKDLNALYKTQNVNQQIVAAPDPKNPSRFIPQVIDVEPTAPSMAEVQEAISKAPEGMDVTAEAEVNGVKVKVSTPKSEKKDVIDPTKFSTKFQLSNGDPIAYGPTFYKQVVLGTSDKDMLRGAEIIDLTPDGSLPLFPDPSNPQIQESYVPNKDFLVVSPRPVSGQVPQATQNMRDFFTTFTPDTLRTVVRNKATNPTAYRQVATLLQKNVFDWVQATQLKTNEFIRLQDVKKEFKDELKILLEVNDAGLIQAIDKGYSQQVRNSNAEVDLPEDTPPIVNPQTGDVEVSAAPTISMSSLVVRDGNGTATGYTPSFNSTLDRVSSTKDITGIGRAEVLGLVKFGVVPGQDSPTPEGAVRAAKSLDDLSTLFASLYPERTLTIDSGFAVPTFLPQQKQTVRSALRSFSSVEGRLGAVKATLPRHVLERFDSDTTITRGSSAEAVYNLVSPGRPFKEVAGEVENARKTVETADQILAAFVPDPETGVVAQTGFVAEFARVRRAVSYFTEQIVDEAGKTFDRRLGFDEAVVIDGRSYSANETIINDLNTQLDAIERLDDEQAKRNALLKFNLRVLSYAYAAMLDPNGRLSDADREAADAAIGNSLLAYPEQIITVTNEIRGRANYLLQRGIAYTSGSSVDAYAMKVVDTTIAGAEARPVQDIITSYLPTAGTQSSVATPADQALLNEGLGAPATPSPSTPAPAPAPQPIQFY